jgi:HD-like signal output (HDOD) protein
MARFNLHSLATATAAEILGQQTICEHSEQAFIAGLFHDIGELLLVHAYPTEYAALLEGAPLTGKDLEACEHALFGLTHADISSAAAAYWNLSEAVQTAVRFHESPREEDLRKAGFTLSETVHAADRYADFCGHSSGVCKCSDDTMPETVLPPGVYDEQIRPTFVQQLTVLRP